MRRGLSVMRDKPYLLVNTTVQHRMLDLCESIIESGQSDHVVGCGVAIKQLLLSKRCRRMVGPRCPKKLEGET